MARVDLAQQHLADIFDLLFLDIVAGVVVRHLAQRLDQARQLRLRRLAVRRQRLLDPLTRLLDEPPAGLTKTERILIGEILVELSERDGLCILLIEHDLDFVCDISSRIVVLHQGKLLLDGTVDEVVSSDLVRAIYSGEQLAQTTEDV